METTKVNKTTTAYIKDPLMGWAEEFFIVRKGDRYKKHSSWRPVHDHHDHHIGWEGYDKAIKTASRDRCLSTLKASPLNGESLFNGKAVEIRPADSEDNEYHHGVVDREGNFFPS